MIYLQLSAAQGPAECALAVAHALRLVSREAAALSLTVDIIESAPGVVAPGLASVLLALNGENKQAFAQAWQGNFRWTCVSPLRPTHKRKNWFFGGELILPPEPVPESEIVFEALRASGPGGQHVNKTDSAIRATHIATGISVKVQSERSQHANKKLALWLIARQLQQRAAMAESELTAKRRLLHHQLKRGGARRCFVGPEFIPR